MINVHAGLYSPVLPLKAFIKEAGTALSTVSSLSLQLLDASGSAVSAIVLGEALVLLVVACRSLRSLTFQGYMCPVLLKMLGQVSPLLSEFVMQIHPRELPHVKRTILMLRSLVPNLTSLGIKSCTPLTQLPDMYSCNSILQLDLGNFEFSYSIHWCCMPPNLRHLKCGAVNVGPPIIGMADMIMKSSLQNLQSLDVFNIRLPLNALIQLMLASPSLRTFRTWSNHSDDEIYVAISLHHSTADDLCLMAATKLVFLQHASYVINCNRHDAHELELAPHLAYLPCMAGVTRCEIQECHYEDLGPLLSVFPNVRALTLRFMSNLNDVDLQVVAGCQRLAQLELTYCSMVTAMGILALCQRLPGLGTIKSDRCAQLTQVALCRCQRLLGRQLACTVVTEKT